VRLAADHDRQARLACADVAARHRRIHRMRTPSAGCGVDLAGEARFAGAHIDEDLAGARSRDRAALAEQDRAHVCREAQHREDDIGLRDHRAWIRCPACAARDQRFGLALGAAM